MLIIMKKALLSLFLFSCLLSAGAQAQAWKDALTAPVIVEQNGKWTITDFLLLTFEDETTRQIKIYSEAPIGGLMTRDNFIAFASQFSIVTIYELFPGEYAPSSIDELDEIIGNADLELSSFMSNSGIQVEAKGDLGVNRTTYTWEEWYDE